MTASAPDPGAGYDPVLRTQADVESAWRHLLRPLGWSGRSLWFMPVLGDDRPTRDLGRIEDVPERIDGLDAHSAARFFHHLLGGLGPGARVALLLSRPGRTLPDANDAANAAALYAGLREVGVATEVIHLATDVDVHPLPWDGLTAVSA